MLSPHVYKSSGGGEYIKGVKGNTEKRENWKMKIDSLMRFGVAAHYSYTVESPYLQRGGVLLVAGPANLKSMIIENTLKPFPNALVYSDLTIKQLAIIRNQISNGIYHTLGFLELEKIYARNLSVALNFEGAMKAMVEEGFSHFAFEDQRCWVPTARCFMYASVLDSLYRFHFGRWMDNGFLRRFIVIKYRLSATARRKMREAQHTNELIPMPSMLPFPTGFVRMDVSKQESIQLEQCLGFDETQMTPFNLCRKVLTLFKWYHKQNGKHRGPTPMEIFEDLKTGIGNLGGELEL